MKRLSLISLATVAGILLIAAQVFAYSFNVDYENGTIYETTALTGFHTDGNEMDGMKVTAYFTDGTSETAIWKDTEGLPTNDGAASTQINDTFLGFGYFHGNGWTLKESGDTFSSKWSFDLETIGNLAIRRLVIDAGAGDTIFDVKANKTYTSGSSTGKAFDVSSASHNLDITATYRDLVALKGQAPMGDLYRTLTIAFNNESGFGGDSKLTFYADTDNLRIAGDLQPTVPEPGTIILLGAGIAGLVAFRKKFRK